MLNTNIFPILAVESCFGLICTVSPSRFFYLKQLFNYASSNHNIYFGVLTMLRMRVSGGSSIGRIRRTPPVIGENIEFSCIFLNKVKLTPLFSAKMWLTPPPLAHSGSATAGHSLCAHTAYRANHDDPPSRFSTK